MDKLISKLTALGVPALILVLVMSSTGLSGAAAITAGLAALGPFGMLGGIASLGVLLLLSQGISEYGVEAIFSALVKSLYNKGETKESILEEIDKYPVSKSLKRKLKENLEKF